MKDTRIVWLDAVKGICVLLIMINHYCGIPYIGHFLSAGYVQTFFIASGYTFKDDINRTRILKRVKRLLIPYFFYGTFFCLIMFIYKDSIKELILNVIGLIYSRFSLYPYNQENNIILLGPNAPMWFLTALFTSTFLTYFYFSFKRNKMRLIIILLFIIVTRIMEYLPILLPWSFDTAFISSLFIIIGYYLMKNKLFLNINNKITAICVSLFLYIILVHYNPNINMSVREYGKLGILSFICIGILHFFIISLFSQLFENNIIIKFLSKVGKSSLRILCIHYPLFLILSYYLRHFINSIYIYSIIIGVIVTLIAITTESKLSRKHI